MLIIDSSLNCFQMVPVQKMVILSMLKLHPTSEYYATISVEMVFLFYFILFCFS